jgi:hypothetical protein
LCWHYSGYGLIVIAFYVNFTLNLSKCEDVCSMGRAGRCKLAYDDQHANCFMLYSTMPVGKEPVVRHCIGLYLLLLLAWPAWAQATPVRQDGALILSPQAADLRARAGGSAVFQITITNGTSTPLGGLVAQVQATIDYGSLGGQPTIQVNEAQIGDLNPGEGRVVTLFINVPANRPPNEANVLTLRVVDGTGSERGRGVYRLLIEPVPQPRAHLPLVLRLNAASGETP